MNVPAVRAAVRRWASTVDRPLPWRGERDPYRVLVSEVMLQQTQAARVAEAYPAFLRSFPTLRSLASAEAADVIRAWGTLGYNRRALNLWRTARACPDGLPAKVGELQRLPGIGPYTARAVASFAFGADTAPVDANVRRILTRLAPGAEDVQALADGLLAQGRSAEWNQALFDLGALVCRPGAPCCDACPLRRRCAWALGERPQRVPRRTQPRFETTTRYARGRVVAVLREEGSLTLADVSRRTRLPHPRVRDAVDALVGDGLVSRRGRRIELGIRR